MKCAWKELLGILPAWMRRSVDEQGRDMLQELRLRLGLPPELVMKAGSIWLKREVQQEDISFCVNAASRYSPWAASTIGQGYITAPGGHRLGLCGDAVTEHGQMRGMRNIRSVCIRVARDFPGISDGIPLGCISVLILGRPGSGKTTLLRDLIRQRSEAGPGSIAVVDERGELFPGGFFSPGRRTDILTGCGKATGVDTALRTMGPSCIAVDEITAEEDCQALMRAGWCGVTLFATAHASGVRDLYCRPIYQALVKSHLFETTVVLQPDRSWKLERMEKV